MAAESITFGRFAFDPVRLSLLRDGKAVAVGQRGLALLQARRRGDTSPGITLARIRRGQHAKDPHRIDVLIEGMRLAGMAEG